MLGDGSVMRLTYDGKEIFHETKVQIGGDTEFKKVASKDGRSVLPGDKTPSLSVEGYLSHEDAGSKAAVKDIVDAWNAQTKAAFTVTDGTTGNISFGGEAYIKGWTVNADNDEFISFSYTLEVEGDLAITTVAV